MNCKDRSHWEALGEITNLKLITLQFPDPWTRKRNRNRRLVDPDFASLIKDMCDRQSGPIQIFISTDRKDIFEEMYETIRGVFGVQGQMLKTHPLEIGTERDRVCEHLHRNVNRAPSSHGNDIVGPLALLGEG
jgi:tRNA (guanine-N7-)-methyltransferase